MASHIEMTSHVYENLIPITGNRVCVSGRVGADVSAIPFGEGGQKIRLTLYAKYIESGGKSFPGEKIPLGVTWYGALNRNTGDAGAPGPFESWEFTGVLRARKNRYSGDRLYYLNTREADSSSMPTTLWGRWCGMCDDFRRSAAKRLRLGIEENKEAVAVLDAMLLGYRRRMPFELYKSFRDSGTVHVFAISGLHVGMIVAMLFVLLPLTGLSRQVWFPLVLPLLFAYTVSTGGRPSAVRACLMALAFFLGPLVGRRPDGLSSLALAALLIVGWDPPQLMEAGFVLSFVVVGGLMSLGQPIGFLLKKLFGWHTVDVSALRVAVESGEGGLWLIRERFRLWIKVRFLQLLTLSVTAWLCSLPLTAFYFGRVSLLSMVANLMVVPLAFFVVLCGCLSLVTGAVWGVFSEIFNNAALAIITLLTSVTRIVSSIPFSVVDAPRPPVWGVLLWYMLLFAGAWWVRRYQRREEEESGGLFEF